MKKLYEHHFVYVFHSGHTEAELVSDMMSTDEIKVQTSQF